MNSVVLRHISLRRSLGRRMSSTNSSYEDAICKLNSLQSNKSTLEQIRKGLKTGEKCTNIEDMENYLKRIGIPMSKLDELSVIHVAGTKGKGSTSAMCESILRHHGYRTGFYSSPHLVAARERIRLDGRPLSREHFATSVHQVYSLLQDSQEFDGDMPKYFAFLTVVAFHVFLQQQVDVAVVEVGIGGIVDYTNVLRKVPVVGITALGLDHTSILGNSLAEIARAKAGVMKRTCAAYTVRQPDDAMQVLAHTATRVQCPLTVVPDYSSYTFHDTGKPHLPVDIQAYRTNASLAIQLSHAWMRATQANILPNGIDHRNSKDLNGLNNDNVKLNGLHSKVTNITNMDQNGYDVNKLNKSHEIITNGINMDQNGMMNGNIHRNGFHNNPINGINTDRNGFINGQQNKMINETNMAQNSFINGSINISPKNMTNGTNKDHNGVAIIDMPNGSQNKLSNGTNENILRNGYTSQAKNGLKTRNSIQNWSDNVQNSLFLSGAKNKADNGLTNSNIVGGLVYEVPYETSEGLRQCKWPGRYQLIRGENATFYLDGAHTKESMEICAHWFTDNTRSAEMRLIFSATGDRNVAVLLEPLASIPFRHVYFVVPTAHRATSTNQDNYTLVEQEELVQRCHTHAQIWRRHNATTQVTVLECVSDALSCIQSLEDKPSVLITGSLHLVGAALSILDPTLSS